MEAQHSDDLYRHAAKLLKSIALASHNPQPHRQLEVTAQVAFGDFPDSFAHMRRVDTSRCSASSGPGGEAEPPIYITPLSLLSAHRTHPPQGGFEAHFVTQLDDKHKCLICLLALREPVQTNCGHRFCQWCFQKRQQHFSCPVDNIPLLKAFPDNLCKREVLCLPVKCPNCSWTGQLRKLQDHIDACFMIWDPCPHADLGCRCRLPKYNLQEHVQSECEYRDAICTLCRTTVILKDLEVHQRNLCPEVDILCTNNCGATVKRKEMADHIRNACCNTVSPCRFREFGCQFMGNHFSLGNHIAGSLDSHMALLCERDRDQDRRISQLEEEKNEQERLMGEMRQQLVSLSNRFSQVEESLNAEQRVSAEVATLAQCTDTGNGATAANAVVVDKAAACGQDDAGMSAVQQNATSPVTITRQVVHVNTPIGHTDATLAEADLHLCEQTTSFGSVLILKVPDFHRYFAEAQAGKKPSLYSPPFYTSRHGYKMCVRVYLYGDGVGKGSHMSIFFVVMRGEFDTRLAWPFRQKVTLTLLDQSPEKRHISDTFMPDPRSSSFQRPSSEMNIASGCPRFVSIDALRTSNGYVKDNTMFLRATVDCTGLPTNP